MVNAGCVCDEAALLRALIKHDILTTFCNYARTPEQEQQNC
jgi:hypothetical protein